MLNLIPFFFFLPWLLVLVIVLFVHDRKSIWLGSVFSFIAFLNSALPSEQDSYNLINIIIAFFCSFKNMKVSSFWNQTVSYLYLSLVLLHLFTWLPNYPTLICPFVYGMRRWLLHLVYGEKFLRIRRLKSCC